MSTTKKEIPTDFIRQMIREDMHSGKHGGRVVTRFPPEPNGYPHIGHAKSICLNFGIAEEMGGVCHLRFDDTNPETESMEFVEAIQRDIRWLGFDWGDKLFFASDYFEQLYQFALQLIRDGKAYVDSSSDQEIRQMRGSVTEAGQESPYRGRSVEENLALFEQMRSGELPDGSHVLRAKIDMASPNMKMRDPLLYRIRHAHHYRTGDKWCIYPMYDFAHPLSDAIEGVTHSLCTLEFENNRELYDWLIANVDVPYHPEQTEFARLNLSYTIVSKRMLLQLVQQGKVNGWDDPRLPTLSALRRRGVTPRAIRSFCEAVGVAKNNSVVDVARLEHAVRDDLNSRACRVLAVLRPLKVVIETYPEDTDETLDAPYFPREIPREESRPLPFRRELWIERQDFREDPPKKFHRLAPGRAVRLRHAYVIRCDEVIKDAAGEVVELRCSHDPGSLTGRGEGWKIHGTIHWVSAADAGEVEVRLYDRLFSDPVPNRGKGGPDFKTFLNPSSLEVLTAKIEPAAAHPEPGSRLQLERHGYFYVDPADSTESRPVLNRIVPLRDSWGKSAERRALPDAAAPAKGETMKPGTQGRRKRVRSGRRKERSSELRELAERLRQAYGLSPNDARVLTLEAETAAFFEATLEHHDSPGTVARWMVNGLQAALKGCSADRLPFGPPEMAHLVALVDTGKITASAAKDVLAEMLDQGGDPVEIVARRGLGQLDDDALTATVDQVLTAHPEQLRALKEGKTQLLGFFVGQVMQATRGRADAKQVQQLLRRQIGL